MSNTVAWIIACLCCWAVGIWLGWSWRSTRALRDLHTERWFTQIEEDHLRGETEHQREMFRRYGDTWLEATEAEGK